IKSLKQPLALVTVVVLSASNSLAGPVTVAGDAFILVATNGSGIQLYSLTADNNGNVYASNNSQGPGIPVQRFRPGVFTGMAMPFDNFGPICNDGDGLIFGAGYLYVADVYAGIRKISVTNASASIFSSQTTTLCGSPLSFRLSDGHLFSNVGCQTNKIQEFDSLGNIVTNYTTTAGGQTMAFDSESGLIYYASYPAGGVYAYNPTSRTDTFVTTINGSIDGGLAVDRISNRLFVGTANGTNQGQVYTMDLTTHTVSLFASGFNGCLGILREQVSGDLYFLEYNNLYRLASAGVTNGLLPRLLIWPAVELGWVSETNKTYQVQWSTNLMSSNWFNFGSSLPGNGSTNFLFDSTRASPNRFYRIIVVQ